MTSRRLVIPCLSASLLAVAACGSGSGTTVTSVTSTVTAAPTLPSTTTPMPASVDFELTVGENSGRDTLVEVRLGTTVTLRVNTTDSIDEIHIHGYDLYLEDLAAGSAASITFVANIEGAHEVERHDTGEVLMMLRVT